MLVEILIVLLILFCTIARKSKLVFLSFSLLMVLLMMYTTYNADYIAYSGRYMYFVSAAQIFDTDPAIGVLMYLCKQLRLSYAGFLGVVSSLGLAVAYYVYNRYSKITCVQLVFYFILLYATHTIQLRSFVAEWIAVLAVMYYLQDDAKDAKYALLILLAGTFHYSVLFYLLMLIPKHLVKPYKVLAATCLIGAFFPFIQNIFSKISFANAQARMAGYFAAEAERFGVKSVIFIVCFILLSFLVFYLANKNKKQNNLVLADKLQMVANFNIITWIALGLIVVYSNNFFRLNRPMIIVSLLFIINYYFEKMGECKVSLTSLSFSFVMIAAYVATEMLGEVWYTNIQNNLIFQTMNFL